MEFGALTKKELEKVIFKLPAEPKNNSVVLKKGKGGGKVFLGCAKWGRREWIGKIYPKGTKEKDFLHYYGKHYDSIELNATHYKIYGPEKFKEWMKEVDNPAFRFCPKAHRGMSFMKHSPTRDSVTKDFLKYIRTLKNELGPVFITHDEKIKWDEQGEKDFFRYLESLPKDIVFFIEERWADFYRDRKLMDRYYAKLRELNIGSVITDTAGRRDVLHMNLTTPKTFIRFVGNSLHPTDFKRIDQWANRIKKWLDTGIDEIYFFMHMHDEGKSPELTQYVVQSFNRKCKLDLPEVEFVS
ncbi:DUF72 domain-containing protein [Pollutibacter soli]|uniref:DUF72 domain-containing protein n=1 Tax=Pollutibacter soli TaxID=3034157 RepID=UPI00301381F3